LETSATDSSVGIPIASSDSITDGDKGFTGGEATPLPAETGAFSDDFSDAFAETSSIVLTSGTSLISSDSSYPKSESAALSSLALGLAHDLGLNTSPLAFRFYLLLPISILGFRPNRDKA
jgi:hypothetical protein